MSEKWEVRVDADEEGTFFNTLKKATEFFDRQECDAILLYHNKEGRMKVMNMKKAKKK